MQEHKYLKEEFHRGEWQPLMVEKKGKKIQSYAKITHEQAEIMNVNKKEYKVRYVLPESEDEFDLVKAEYEALAEKKAFHGWTLEQLKEKIVELKK